MINIINHTINIDLVNKINMNQPINIKKNDTNSHKLAINLFNNGASHVLTGTTSKIYFKKPDGTNVFLDCVLDGSIANKLSVLLTTQTLTNVGSIACEITTYGTSGEIQTSFTFNYNVLENIRDDSAIESMSEFTALTDALAVVTGINNKLEISEFTTFKNNTVTSLAEIMYYLTPEMYGAIGDGVTDDTQALKNCLINASTQNKTAYLTKKYNVGGANEILIQDLKNVYILGSGEAEICSNVSKAEGDVLRLLNIQDVDIQGVKFTNNASDVNSKDNSLVMFDCGKINIEYNWFSDSDNKHIHIQGTDVKNVSIHYNTFERSMLNANPDLNQFISGSIYFSKILASGADSNLKDIDISSNVFKDNAYGCIFVGNNDVNITNMIIKNNTFARNGCCLTLCQIENLETSGNVYQNNGFKNIENFYNYDVTTNKFISKIRVLGGQSPIVSNTLAPNNVDTVISFSRGGMKRVSIRDKFIDNYNFCKSNGYVQTSYGIYGVDIDGLSVDSEVDETMMNEIPVRSFFAEHATLLCKKIFFAMKYYAHPTNASTSYPLLAFNTNRITEFEVQFGTNVIYGLSYRYMFPFNATPSNFNRSILALQSSWVESAIATSPVFVRKSGDVVEVVGTISSGVETAGTLLFTVPSNYLPATLSEKAIPVSCYAGGTFQIATLRVYSNGQVKIYNCPAGATIYLDNLKWLR